MHRLYATRGEFTRRMQLFPNMDAPLFLLPLYNDFILIHLALLPLTSAHTGRVEEVFCFFLPRSFFVPLFFLFIFFLTSKMGTQASRHEGGRIREGKENSFNVFDPCGRCELSPCLTTNLLARSTTNSACLLCLLFFGCEGHLCVVVCAARIMPLAIPGDKCFREKSPRKKSHTHDIQLGNRMQTR